MWNSLNDRAQEMFRWRLSNVYFGSDLAFLLFPLNKIDFRSFCECSVSNKKNKNKMIATYLTIVGYLYINLYSIYTCDHNYHQKDVIV